jgi:DNA recombination protein RmuC
MQKLAGGVDQLQRVLTNVKARGTFGETQLGALLEQALAQSQYEANCVTVPGSNARVEFAIKLPGQDQGGTVLLPIDAKFPNEDYLRLQEAAERCDVEAVARERKNLAVRLEAMAKDIREKYVSAPHTTDFAMMFLPTEGLYAEALRLNGLTERIQSQHNVVVVGPTTLLAVLNSFQMGFRTLAIQKRSGEVWQVLGAVKEEFAKFGDSLEAVRKKLQEAQNKIEFSQRRSRVMNRKLKQVESFDGEEGAAALLGLDEEDEEDAEVEVPAE